MATKFYSIMNASRRSEVRFSSKIEYDEWALTLGKICVQEPFAVIVSEGKNLYDIAWLQDVSNFSVSDRIHNILKSEGITGWRSYPLDIEGREEKYWGIQVIGRAGPPFRPQEGFIEGLLFDLSTWDGSDFFVLEGTVSIILTERLQQLLVQAKTTNLALKEISTIRWYSATSDK